MSYKKFETLCKKFSKKSGLTYFEETEYEAKRAIFLDDETGTPIAMLRCYRNIFYHPCADASPVEAVKHGIILASIKIPMYIGEVFYYDDLMEDVFYGEDAIDALYQEI